MATGLVPIPTGISVPWTVPIILNGILATNSILGGVLQIIDFIIVGLIWYPFLKIMDKQNLSV
jgi:PTS system cellobiose-specific IIC component